MAARDFGALIQSIYWVLSRDCNQFCTKHAPDMLHADGRTERGLVDLNLRLAALAPGTAPHRQPSEVQ